MATFGLIGFPLGHSFSRKYFTEKFEREGLWELSYENFPLENISMLPDMLRSNPLLKGFNVTIPYKEQVIGYLNGLSDEAASIGAVNCVKIIDGKLMGYNTDTYGFRKSLLELIGNHRPQAMVLGTGGASKAVKYVLSSLGIRFLSVSRTKSSDTITYDEIGREFIISHPLIINTTPLGTYPDVDSAPEIPYEYLSEQNFLFDAVYNPALTKFLAYGRDHDSRIMNGYDMLVGQAERSWKIWTE